MGYENLEVEREGHVAFLWLNRPEKLNALSADMWHDIFEDRHGFEANRRRFLGLAA